MREIPIFIASSVREFERERQELFSLLDTLNATFGKRDAKLVWNPPETNSRTLTFGGKQLDFDKFIPISDFFIMIIGERVGRYTRHEYELALRRFKRTRKPNILPCFLKTASQEARNFLDSIRRAEIGTQYVDFYKNFGDIKNQIQQELTEYVVNSAETDDEEAETNNRLNGIKRKIYTLRGEIKHLETLTVTQETIAEITYQYANMARLVREYKVEPDALLDYMEFLWKQHQYDTAIEIGHWLEGFYQMDPPPPDGDWQSGLKNRLGVCYNNNHQHGQAERYYREELEIERRLAEANPALFLPDVATTCNNLAILLENTNRMETAHRGALEIYKRLAEANPAAFESYVATTCNNLGNLLLKNTNRMEEAETVYREALEIYKRLAKTNPAAFESYVAAACNNLGNLLKDTNRMKEALKSYWEALEIYMRLAETNPDAFESYVATTYNNLAALLYSTNQMEEAAKCYQEALEIRRRLAKANPDAFESDVADTCNNLAALLHSTNQMEEAENCYREALEIYKRLAEANPATFESYVATTCYNLGAFKVKQDYFKAAQHYFEEALSLYEKFPHLAHKAQKCRDILVALSEVLAELQGG